MAETISQTEFDDRLGSGKLALTLVGMSNVGKSFWTERLVAGAGFEAIGCDDLIGTELESVLEAAGFNSDIKGVATWMGQPYEPQSAANQKTYVDLETMTMRQTIGRLARPNLGGNIVVDTTGSVVHTDPRICEALAQHSTVVYLEATASMRLEMFNRYIDEPKPVVWGDIYQQAEGQSDLDALGSSYIELLDYRSALYADMAHVTVPREVSLTLPSANHFLAQVRELLPV